MHLANDFIYSAGIHHYSGDNTAYQYAMKTSLYDRLARLSQQQQWILVTSESHRPDLRSLVSHKIPSHKVVQLRSSRTMDEYHVIRKAILSGNASAIVASQQLTEQEQMQLVQLGRQNQCEVFFIATPRHDYH